MPVYQYACQECNHRFEQRQSIHEDPLTQCPVCQGSIHRIINPVGIIFKGSGFYITDNKNGKNGLSAPGKKAAINGENGTETKTEKPENGTAKTEEKAEVSHASSG